MDFTTHQVITNMQAFHKYCSLKLDGNISLFRVMEKKNPNTLYINSIKDMICTK